VAGPDQANMLNSIVNFDEKLYCLLELISEQGSGGLGMSMVAFVIHQF